MQELLWVRAYEDEVLEVAPGSAGNITFLTEPTGGARVDIDTEPIERTPGASNMPTSPALCLHCHHLANLININWHVLIIPFLSP